MACGTLHLMVRQPNRVCFEAETHWETYTAAQLGGHMPYTHLCCKSHAMCSLRRKSEKGEKFALKPLEMCPEISMMKVQYQI